MGLLDILFPKRCVNCKKIGEYVCSNCFSSISFDVQNICVVCNSGSIDGLTHPRCKSRYTIDGIFCGLVYKGVVKKLVYQMKYQPYVSHVTEFSATLLYESLIQQEAYNHVLQTKPTIIPIPLSRKKFRQRGYNQSALLAQFLSKQLDVEISDCLVRKKETTSQVGLKKEERRENMKDAFEFKTQKTEITSAFLIDDVLTTGSTLLEAANVLKRNGFRHVWGICLARDQ